MSVWAVVVVASAWVTIARIPALLVHTTESRYPNVSAERGLDTLARVTMALEAPLSAADARGMCAERARSMCPGLVLSGILMSPDVY